MSSFLPTFFYSQLFVTPPVPTQSFEGRTVIVTGANTGLGHAVSSLPQRHHLSLESTETRIFILGS